ncbi:hypothetical protein BH23CHL5_BH23CHL5_14600 [soil metagenome]
MRHLQTIVVFGFARTVVSATGTKESRSGLPCCSTFEGPALPEQR